MDRIYPIPEILDDGRGWVIQHDEKKLGFDYETKVILAPLDNDPVSHNRKLQQIAKIRWDDRSVNVPPYMKNDLIYKAVEDHRINFLLDKVGVNIGAGFLTDDIKLKYKSHEHGELLLMLMQDYTNDAIPLSVLEKHKESKVVADFLKVKQWIRENASKANVVEIVKWLLERYLSGKSKSISGLDNINYARFSSSSLSSSVAIAITFEQAYELALRECPDDLKLIEIPEAVRKELPNKLPETMKIMDKEATGYFIPWGTASILEPPREVVINGKFMKKWKATDEGAFPRYPHRYAVDQRVFARRCKVPGGTVIIDNSGSMNLTSEEIQAIVEAAPGCVVANYSGRDYNGAIQILAKNGKRVSDKFCAPPHGGGNIIDYHALLWACKQNHPRIWVSDLEVTGVEDIPSIINYAMCAAVAKKGKFFHAKDTSQAIEILKRLGTFYKKY